MKRQFGPMLATLALMLCVPVAWCQSGSTDSGGSTDSSSTPSSSSSTSVSSGASQGGFTNSALNDPYYQTTDSSQSGSDDSSQSSTNGPQSTFNHPELLPPINAITEATKNTGLGLSFNTGSLSNYNWVNHGAPGYWLNVGMWGGGVSLTQVRPTSMVFLSYVGGVSLSSMTYGTGQAYTNLYQSATARILWNFANRWQLKIKDNFIYTDNPFEPFLSYTSDPTPNNPNPGIYFPAAVVEQNSGSVDLIYRLSQHDSLDFAGYESFQKYIRGVTGLWNSFSYTGAAFYQHMFSTKLSAGTGYSFTAIDFGHGQSRAGVQMIESFIAYKFNHEVSVSAWVGPEYTGTKNLVPLFCLPSGCLIEEMYRSQWDVAEGATFSLLHNGNSIRASFSHRVTDGGGILGAINLYEGTIAYARPISRVWGFASAIMYDTSESISHILANQYWDAIQGTINFNRKFGDGWNGSIYLLFINQSQNFYGTPGTTTSAGIGLTLRYLWGTSLGR